MIDQIMFPLYVLE